VSRTDHWLGAPRPWHVLLSPALPILALWGGNFGGLRLDVAARSVLAGIVAALIATVIVARIARNLRTAALAVSLITTVLLSRTTFSEIISATHLPVPPLAILLAAIAVAAGVVRFGHSCVGATTFVNVLMVCSTALVVAPVITSQFHRAQDRIAAIARLKPPDIARQADAPDIYVFILDAYGRTDVLRDYYRFENPLVGELQSLGFTVGSRAASNYGQTAQSLASSLNWEYLPAALGAAPSPVAPRARFGNLIQHNRTFSALRAAGYHIRAYGSEYGLLQPEPADERPRPSLFLTDFEYGLYHASLFPALSCAVGLPPGWAPAAFHRRQILWTLDRLEHDLPKPSDPPTFVFAHLLVPHPPFSFEADGRPLVSKLPVTFDDGSHWRWQASQARVEEQYETGYIKAVQFLNVRIRNIVRQVLNRTDGRQIIFYIQGDHGPGSRVDWDKPERTDFRERLGILLAARFPEERGGGSLYPHVTPVNGMRILMNHALRTNLPLLDDRSYFSPWADPLQFIDATEHVR
jgi:hypothetical protein